MSIDGVVQVFSYTDYRQIVAKFRDKIVDFSDVEQAGHEFALVRHDVEFSVERALKLAELDASMKIASSFLFQVRSNAYNILSSINSRKIQEIADLGCRVGLHLYVSHLEEGDWESLEAELSKQKDIFEFATGLKCDRFSFHRPPKWVLERRDDVVCGMLNMYGPTFFEFSPAPKEIKYLADSRHRFDYGHPLDGYQYGKFQILLHPDEWTEEGFNELDNFRSLEREHLEDFYDTLDSETKNYNPYHPKKNK